LGEALGLRRNEAEKTEEGNCSRRALRKRPSSIKGPSKRQENLKIKQYGGGKEV